jgi:hypothetical protein
VRRLAARRLLQCDGRLSRRSRVRLHDLCREHVRGHTIERERAQHCRLLANYAAVGGAGAPWWECVAGADAPDAEYVCNWLGWHLSEGRGDAGSAEAAALLSEFCWVELKLLATADVAGLLSDYRRWPDQCNKDVGLALGMCAHVIDSEPAQLAFQLLGRLPKETVCSAAAEAALEAGAIKLGGGSGARRISISPPPFGRQPPFLCSVDGPLRSTLTAHTDWIRCLSLSADGQLMLSGSNDMTVKLWSLGDGRLLQNLEGHTHLLRACGFVGRPGVEGAGTGRLGTDWGVSCAEDCRLLTWDLEKGVVLREVVLGVGRAPCKVVCGIPVTIGDDKDTVRARPGRLSSLGVPWSFTVRISLLWGF